jgi:hypothetical protein
MKNLFLNIIYLSVVAFFSTFVLAENAIEATNKQLNKVTQDNNSSMLRNTSYNKIVQEYNNKKQPPNQQYGSREYNRCVQAINEKILHRNSTANADSCESAYDKKDIYNIKGASELHRNTYGDKFSLLDKCQGVSENLVDRSNADTVSIRFCQEKKSEMLKVCQKSLSMISKSYSQCGNDPNCFNGYKQNGFQLKSLITNVEKYVDEITQKRSQQVQANMGASVEAKNCANQLMSQQGIDEATGTVPSLTASKEEEDGGLFSADNLKSGLMLGGSLYLLNEVMKGDDDDKEKSPAGQCQEVANKSMAECDKKANVVLAYHDKRDKMKKNGDEVGEVDPAYYYHEVEKVCQKSLDDCTKSCMNDVSAEDYLKTNPIYNQCKSMEKAIENFHKKAVAAAEIEATEADKKDGIIANAETCLAEGGVQNPSCSTYFMTNACKNFSSSKCQEFVKDFCYPKTDGGIRGEGFVFCDLAKSDNFCHQDKSHENSLSCHWVYNKNANCAENLNAKECLPSFAQEKIDSLCKLHTNDPLCSHSSIKTFTSSNNNSSSSMFDSATNSNKLRQPTNTLAIQLPTWESIVSHSKTPVQKACKSGELKNCK